MGRPCRIAVTSPTILDIHSPGEKAGCLLVAYEDVVGNISSILTVIRLVSMVHINAKTMPTNVTNCSCHIKAVELV